MEKFESKQNFVQLGHILVWSFAALSHFATRSLLQETSSWLTQRIKTAHWSDYNFFLTAILVLWGIFSFTSSILFWLSHNPSYVIEM